MQDNAKKSWDFSFSRSYSLPKEVIEWRRNGIGASDAPAIMEASPWVTPEKLWRIKTNRTFSEPANAAMKRGLDLEPKARRAYEQQSGIAMPAERFEHDKLNFIRASFDGINHEKKRVLEIKCPGPKDHWSAKCGRIPEKYLWQCVHLMLVSGYNELDYFSFDGKNGVTVSIERCNKLERKLLSREFYFWRRVILDIPPKGSR